MNRSSGDEIQRGISGIDSKMADVRVVHKAQDVSVDVACPVD